MKGFFKTFAASAMISAALLMSGMTLQAAEAKETPLSNLAKGINPTPESGGTLENGQFVTDEQKYNLQQAAVIKNSAYVQLDLGAQYSIEVINLKRGGEVIPKYGDCIGFG